MEAKAFAKINLGLEVRRRRPDGYHEIKGLFQSISWADLLELEPAEEDRLGGREVPDGWDNSAWLAVSRVRERSPHARPVRLFVDKQIAVAAGLGGGSADAAAALALAGRLFGVPWEVLVELGPDLGSDVPFCLIGGTAAVAGRGEAVATMSAAGGYAVAVVVPPFELSTPAVYSQWDRIGGPRGPVLAGSGLPPSLRSETPLVNDLYPAAVALAPQLDEWRAELAGAWGRPVVMSGSGPTLYAFFTDEEEAASALEAVPAGARAARAARPVPFGWLMREGEGAPVHTSPAATLPPTDGDWWRVDSGGAA